MIRKLEENSWILYDVGNSAFVLVIVTTIMPIFFKEFIATGLPPATSTANWGFANSLAALVLAISAPLLGTFADYQNYKKRFFIFFLITGLCFTLLLTSCQNGAWFYCLVIYVIARIGWAGANLFYDAFIVDVADKSRLDLVSSRGYAWGYIGSVVPFLLVITLVLLMTTNKPNASAGMPVTGSIPPTAARLGFAIVALWWLLFSLPMLKNVQHRFFLPPPKNPLKDSFSRLYQTFKEIRKFKQAFLFLLAYFFYIDGVDTIISMAAVYGIDVGLGATSLLLAILMIQVVAFPSALVFGYLANKFSAKKMIFVAIGIYAAITLIGFFLPTIANPKTRTLTFWLMSFLVATSMGGIQALSRSYFGKLIPQERSAEFFGFYNVFGKFAAISGPFLMGIFTRITGHSRFGVLSILVLFLTGGIIFYFTGQQTGDSPAKSPAE